MIVRPDINPIRFYQDRQWDYNTDFPSEDNRPSTISDPNIGIIQYVQPWATNNELQFQLLQDRNDNVNVSVFVDGVKQYRITGSDEVSNGDFSGGATDWTESETGTSTIDFTSGYAEIYCPDDDYANFRQTLTGVLTGDKIVVNFDDTTIDGVMGVFLSGNVERELVTESGNKTIILTADIDNPSLAFERISGNTHHQIDNITAKIIQYNIEPLDITPNNWDGDGNYVELYSYTPTAKGCIKFRISEEVLTDNFEYYNSDEIRVETSLPRCKRIEYYNSTNLLDAVFTKDGTRVFFPIIFLEGTNIEPLVGGEKSIDTTPSGMIRNLRSSPTKGSKLMISLLPKAFINKVQMILSCNSMLVNGVYYQSPDNLEPGYIQGSNSNNTSVDLFQTDSTYACSYIPVYDVEPPFYSDLEFWFKKVGTTYVDQISGLTIQESAGYIDFNPLVSTDSKFTIFDRNNLGIQDSALESDFDPTKPFAYSTETVAQNLTGGAKAMVDYYNFGYMGTIYIKDNREEIIVYQTDKGLLDDQDCLEYISKNSYWLDDLDNLNVIVDSKYNAIDF